MDFNTKMKRTPVPREVLIWPNDLLSKVSKPVVTDVVHDQDLQDLLDDMVATLQAYKAAGLAAIQIGVPIRALVVQDERLEPIKMINPVIEEVDGEQFENEGCLSVPGLSLRVRRPKEAVVSYLNEKGERKKTILGDLLGRAAVHEIDHLNGVMFFDKLSKLQRSLALEKYKKLKRKFKLSGQTRI